MHARNPPSYYICICRIMGDIKVFITFIGRASFECVSDARKLSRIVFTQRTPAK